MNRSERAKLVRILNALAAVPFAHDGSGSQTAGVGGFVAFHKDMRKVRKGCEDAMLLLLSPDPDMLPAEQEQQFEEALKPAEEWIAERRAKDWPNF